MVGQALRQIVIHPRLREKRTLAGERLALTNPPPVGYHNQAGSCQNTDMKKEETSWSLEVATAHQQAEVPGGSPFCAFPSLLNPKGFGLCVGFLTRTHIRKEETR